MIDRRVIYNRITLVEQDKEVKYIALVDYKVSVTENIELAIKFLMQLKVSLVNSDLNAYRSKDKTKQKL
eukprot:snap_masked-scaffold_7-processed-gene-1.16-mRNA-1 protein AED:1.00 eAED:1.00 QI:0/-1/0/0/-1/1/1/0/68